MLITFGQRSFTVVAWDHDRTLGTVKDETGEPVFGWSRNPHNITHVRGAHGGEWRGKGLHETILVALRETYTIGLEDCAVNGHR